MSCCFSHVLVLLDCSPVDDAIVNRVVKLVSCSGIRVTLAHVVHSHTLDQDRDLREKCATCLAERLAQFKGAGIDAASLMLSGEPEVEIVRAIEAGDYDLVALATHGHKAFMDVLYGSVSDHLKHSVDIPILMVRGSRSES